MGAFLLLFGLLKGRSINRKCVERVKGGHQVRAWWCKRLLGGQDIKHPLVQAGSVFLCLIQVEIDHVPVGYLPSHSLLKPFFGGVWSTGPGRSRFPLPVHHLQPFHGWFASWRSSVVCLVPEPWKWCLCSFESAGQSVTTCHLLAGSLKWEAAGVQSAHLLLWLICHKSHHPQEPHSSMQITARGHWLVRKLPWGLGRKKKLILWCCRMNATETQGRTMFRVAKHCCCCSVFRELLVGVLMACLQSSQHLAVTRGTPTLCCLLLERLIFNLCKCT